MISSLVSLPQRSGGLDAVAPGRAGHPAGLLILVVVIVVVVVVIVLIRRRRRNDRNREQ